MGMVNEEWMKRRGMKAKEGKVLFVELFPNSASELVSCKP
jgi:hypothetical protein